MSESYHTRPKGQTSNSIRRVSSATSGGSSVGVYLVGVDGAALLVAGRESRASAWATARRRFFGKRRVMY